MDSARQTDSRPRVALAAPGAPPAAVWLRRGGPAAQRRLPLARPRAQGPSGSFDEGGLDYKLAKELDHATWDVRRAAVTKHLELLYQASQSQTEVRSSCCRRPWLRGRRVRPPWLGLPPPPPSPTPGAGALRKLVTSSALQPAAPGSCSRAAQQGGAVRVLRRLRRAGVRLVPRHRQVGTTQTCAPRGVACCWTGLQTCVHVTRLRSQSALESGSPPHAATGCSPQPPLWAPLLQAP